MIYNAVGAVSTFGPFKSGSPALITIVTKDAFGKDVFVNLSKTTLTASSLALASSPTKLLPLPATPTKGIFIPAPPGNHFALTLPTAGLARGTYLLYFFITSDPTQHSVLFTINGLRLPTPVERGQRTP